jgi:hypothetical protein
MVGGAGGAADSLLIVCSSFERRCLGFLRFLEVSARDYRAENVVCVQYGDLGDRQVRERIARFLPEVLSMARRVAGGRPVFEERLGAFDTVEPLGVFRALFASLASGATVTIDISTFPRLHLLYLLEAAMECGRVASLRVVYTRARYGRYDTLSWGSEEPIIVPRLGAAKRDEQARDRLLLFCGLEPDRNYSIWKRFGQNACTAVFVDSGAEDIDRCIDRAMRFNGFVAAQARTIRAFQPEAATDLIEEEYRSATKDGEYLYIAPMTTKWEVLASWAFFRRCGWDVQAGVVYSRPGRLNATGHTLDGLGECLIGQVW